MRVTFMAHSGFLIELEEVCLLFDLWKGTLPELPAQKPLLVFASHRHQDHFSPDIFSLDQSGRTVRFLLGRDLRLTDRRRERWGLSHDTEAHCLVMRGGDSAAPLPGVRVEAFLSTDEGVAFLVTAGGRTIYHAGDLNWWHWAGEDPAWNRNMEVDFKRFCEPLRGRTLQLAMAPLDPRLDEDGFLGFRYLLDLACVERALPMHQWGDFTFTQRFLAAYPQYRETVIPISREGQVFDLP